MKPHLILPIIMDFYKNLYDSSYSTLDSMSPILKVVLTTVNSKMNVSLLHSFTIIEVREAIFSMAVDKSLGPNGISTTFYQHYLDIIGNTTSNLVLDFLIIKEISFISIIL